MIKHRQVQLYPTFSALFSDRKYRSDVSLRKAISCFTTEDQLMIKHRKSSCVSHIRDRSNPLFRCVYCPRAVMVLNTCLPHHPATHSIAWEIPFLVTGQKVIREEWNFLCHQGQHPFGLTAWSLLESEVKYQWLSCFVLSLQFRNKQNICTLRKGIFQR